jgi:hypothetical protein
MLDELAELVRSKVGRAGSLGDSDAFQEAYAKAEMTYRSARALVYETWGEVTDILRRDHMLSVRHHTLIRLALANVTWSAQEVAAFVYKTAGTVALRAGILQRLFRDMHAGTQHITSAPGVIRAAGTELAGLVSNKRWVFLDLVDADSNSQ